MNIDDDEAEPNDNIKSVDSTEHDTSYELGPIYKLRWIDCQDEYNTWYESQIIDISSSSTKIKVHYKGWKPKFDTWIDLTTEPERARLLHTFTVKPASLGTLTRYALDTKCDCLDSTDKWYRAEIVQIHDNGELIKIHYQGWDHKYDEWINKDSYRIAPLHTMTSPGPIINNTISEATTKAQETPKITSPKTPTRRRQNVAGTTIKRKPKFKRNNSDNSPLHLNPNHNVNNVTMLDDNDYKRIDADDDTHNKATDNTVITEEQREKNREIQEKYLSNFKPSLRDEEQFESLLLAKGLIIESMGEDGNCLFRSISHQVYGSESFHMVLRQKCVQYLRSEYSYFGSYVLGGDDKEVFLAYCSRMGRNGIWGDNLEIQAFSEIYGRSIEIYAYDDIAMKTFCNDNDIDDIEPIRLSYHCNSHYNSIVHHDHKGFIAESKVGDIENEKIRLSYLRSSDASQTTMTISDVEATELECFKSALAESRKVFNNNINNQELDIAIKESLTQFEKERFETAKIMSIKEHENRELSFALAKSQYDFMNNNNDNDDIGGIRGIDPLPIHDDIESNAIKVVIEKGYTAEQATMAYSIFEAQQNHIPNQTLIQRMCEYIENTEKATMFGYTQNFYNLQ